MSLDDKRAMLRDRMRGAGWECDRIARELSQCDDIFLGPLHQIKAKTWHNQRSVLVGDAAYCPTPYTGMGTTLAIIGAYILAHELTEHENHIDAFSAYENRFRSFVESEQKLPPGVPNSAYARSKLKVSLFHSIVGIGASKPIQKIVSLFGDGNKEDKFKLPDYGT